jgi:hypothetical protein
VGNNLNPYLPILHRNLPRLLSLYNVDFTDPLCGCGDRRYWAWKSIDFPNGTFQGVTFGLSKLLTAGMLPREMDKDEIQLRIEKMISVVPMLVDRHGGLSEAIPNESSFCVTGLVLGDCLGAIHCLDKLLDKKRRQELVECLEPLAKFLMRQDETHGIISNHLATNALAMLRWAKLTGNKDSLERVKMWLDRIRINANDEGWMLEYGGADPGYQSWCTSALAQISEIAPEFELQSLLDKSFSFLEAFALPDGSYANGCGSRMTRFLMPGGVELQAEKSASAARLAFFARLHISAKKFVSLDSVDEPNLIPFFNDIALAAVNYQKKANIQLPKPKTRDFPNAGLYLHKNKVNIATINIKRGGWISLTKNSSNPSTVIKPEPVAMATNGKVLRAVRGKLISFSKDRMVIQSDLEIIERMLPSPIKFIILRILSLTVFRSLGLGNLIKRLLAKLLILENGKTYGCVQRTIIFSKGSTSDKVLSGNVTLITNTDGFSPSHMASQGYWQVGDDTASKS